MSEGEKAIEYLEDSFKNTVTHKEKLNIIKNLIKSQQEEIEKKDKIINEMAPQVYLNEQQREEMKKYINKLDNRPKDFTSFVKYYFEKKVEESNAK